MSAKERRDHIKAEIWFGDVKMTKITKNFVYIDQPIEGTYPALEPALAAAKKWVADKINDRTSRWEISDHTLASAGWMTLMHGS